MADGEIMRVVLEYSMPGASQVQGVFWYLQSGPANDDDVVDDFEDWANNSWGNRWNDLASDQAEIIGVTVDAMNLDGTVLRNIGAAVLSVAGTVVNNVLPAANAAMMFAPTIYPKSRGRKFVPGIPESAVDDGTFNAAFIADLAILTLSYLGNYIGVSGATYLPGILSLVKGEFVEFGASVGFDTIPDYQRRRRPDRGS